MTEADNRELYNQLKRLYLAGYYSKEMKNLFDIVGEYSGYKRTAYNFFEYLHTKNPALYEAVFEVDYLKQYNDFMDHHEDLKLRGYPYDQFVYDSEVGYVSHNYTEDTIPIKIKFDKIKDADIDNVSVKEEKIYFFINHCISRLENVIYGLNYTYMLGDAATPLENLLIRLIRFFKSYTTELINLENIYLIDLKPENILKLFEEVHKMTKTIVPNEEMHISYADTIQVASSYLLDGGKIGLYDKFIYEIWLIFDNRQGFTNIIDLRDTILKMCKEIQLDEKYYLVDSSFTTSYIQMNDNCKFKDGIIRMYYT